MPKRSKSRKPHNLNKIELSNVARKLEFDDHEYQGKFDDLHHESLPLQEEKNQELAVLMKPSQEKKTQNKIFIRKKKKSFSRNLDSSNSQSSTANIDSPYLLQPLRERVTSDYYSETDTPSKLRRSTEHLRLLKPLNEYIAYSSDEELEEWWKQPKTDYTYSASLSYRDTVTPERRIGSPNMSRRGLRGGYIGTLTSPPYNNSSKRLELSTASADNLSLRSRNIVRGGLSSYSDESDDEESHTFKSSQASIIKRYTSVSSTHSSLGSHTDDLSIKSNHISYGLDVDSDLEESSPQFARPIVRKGITSLLRNSRLQSSKTTSINLNQTEVDSSLVNGGLHTRMGNHIHHTDTLVTETDDSNGYYHSQTDKLHQNWWKEVYTRYSSYVYSKVSTTLTLIYANIILWSTYGINSIKKIFTRTSIKRSPLFYASKTKSPFKYKMTSTTILSRRYAVTTYMESLLMWYEKKRAESPFLWGWLPLILIFLLIPFLGSSDQEDLHAEKFKFPLSQSSQSYSVTHEVLSSIWKKITFASTTFSNYLYLSFGYLKYLIISIFNLLTSLINWFWNLLLLLASSVRSFLMPAKSGEQYSTLYSYPLNVLSATSSYVSESIKTGSTSFTTFISTVYSSVLKSIQMGSCSVLCLISETLSMILNGFSILWNGLLWTLSTVWSFVVILFVEAYGLTSNILSGFMKLPYKFYMLIPFANQETNYKLKTSTVKSDVSNAPSETQTLATSDDLMRQILLNPDMETLILQSIEKHDTTLKEKLSSEIRENLESKFENMKTEFVSLHKHAEEFSATIKEILSLKEHQHNLQIKFNEVEDILRKVVLNQENSAEESVNNLHLLKEALGEMSLKIGKLGEEIDEMQKNHKSIEAELKSCCRNASLLTVEQVKDHLRVLLSDLMGFPKVDGEESEDLSLRFKQWVGKYFVAKEEMESKLEDLQRRMQKISDEAVNDETLKQTGKQVMETVLNLLRMEMKSEYQILKDNMNSLRESSDSSIYQLNTKMEENKDSLKDHKQQIKNDVEQSLTHNVEAYLMQLIESLASDDHLSVDMRNKLLEILTPLIEETVEKSISNNDFKNIIDARVSQIVTEKVEVKFDQAREADHKNITTDWWGFNASEVEKIVQAALLKYDADKTGLADHALESAGGSIVSTRCTEGYEGHLAELSVFGYSIYRYSTNTPRSIIQPDTNPGQCFAFKGSEGYVVIQLAEPIRVSAFTLEHIPKSLTPYSTIDSAVKEFSVFGLQRTEDEGFHFGRFVYKDNGEPLQYFPVHNYTDEYFKYVELKVHSNHGNMKYTCVYRFRVHGVRENLIDKNGL